MDEIDGWQLPTAPWPVSDLHGVGAEDPPTARRDFGPRTRTPDSFLHLPRPIPSKEFLLNNHVNLVRLLHGLCHRA